MGANPRLRFRARSLRRTRRHFGLRGRSHRAVRHERGRGRRKRGQRAGEENQRQRRLDVNEIARNGRSHHRSNAGRRKGCTCAGGTDEGWINHARKSVQSDAAAIHGKAGCEGFPAFLLAFAALRFLPDGPQSAPWLTSNEKNTIAAQLTVEDSAKQHDLRAALIDPRVFALALVNFGVLLGAYGVQPWLPQIVQGMGFSNSQTGVVVALPYAMAMGAMILWGRSSDLRGERIWHAPLPALLAAAGLAVVSMTESDVASLVALTVAVIGILCANALVFSLPGSFLHGPAAAGGIALIVSISSLGGFIGPTIVGVLNVGFAALTMNKDLDFTPTVFGLGAGIFFVASFSVRCRPASPSRGSASAACFSASWPRGAFAPWRTPLPKVR
jgi:hypothetical protein